MSEGYIYCVSNKSLPGKVKVGFTTNFPSRRMKQLSNTSIDSPFELNFYIKVDNVRFYESFIHKTLQDLGIVRPNPRREFFECSPDKVSHVFTNICKKQIYYLDSKSDSDDKEQSIPSLPSLSKKPIKI
jgi:hypothetical protein